MSTHAHAKCEYGCDTSMPRKHETGIANNKMAHDIFEMGSSIQNSFFKENPKFVDPVDDGIL